jgi:hypothetical protein
MDFLIVDSCNLPYLFGYGKNGSMPENSVYWVFDELIMVLAKLLYNTSSLIFHLFYLIIYILQLITRCRWIKAKFRLLVSKLILENQEAISIRELWRR